MALGVGLGSLALQRSGIQRLGPWSVGVFRGVGGLRFWGFSFHKGGNYYSPWDRSLGFRV